jgi:tetratricopeptide (TPR) repeat protein
MMRIRAGALGIGGALLLFGGHAYAGYTHYWDWSQPPAAEPLRAAVADMKRLAEAGRDVVEFEATADTIRLNGRGEEAHEDFVFPGPPGFNFTKTAGKPYDVVVSACLLAAREHFPPEVLAIHSDGGQQDWAPGRAFFLTTLKRTPPPMPELSRGARRAPPLRRGLAALFWGTGGLLGSLLMIGLAYAMFTRNRGYGGGGWASYYLIWMVAPLVIAAVSAYPAIALVAVAGLVLRRWLPDPYVYLRHSRRMRSLAVDVGANPANVTARRDLARLWLLRRRPRRALPLVKQALERDPESVELRYLHGVCLLLAGDHEPAIAELVEVVQRDPRYLYGEPYLRAADALARARRWEDAEEALEHLLKVNGSSVEGYVKLARVRRKLGNASGAAQAQREAKSVYAQLPRFQRRRQLAWYLRARVGL